MTRTIVAILALSPAVLFAQATSPAQPSSTPVLSSSLVAPVAFAATKSENGSANTATLRISTGVVGPKLLHSVNLSPDLNARLSAVDQKLVLEMTVSPAGVPTDLKVITSSDSELTPKVLAAISQYRYKPGMLDGQPTAVPIRLEIKVPSGTAY